jgi:hypothetical protein
MADTWESATLQTELPELGELSRNEAAALADGRGAHPKGAPSPPVSRRSTQRPRVAG